MASVEVHQIQKVVKKKLENDVRTRDSDLLLCALIWADELKHPKVPVATALDFLKEYAHGNTFTNAESIRRARQKIQEDNLELRGKLYGKRKQNESNIQGQLGYNA